MKTIWRYDVPLGPPVELEIPSGPVFTGTVILHVGKSRSGVARDGVSFWVEVNTHSASIVRRTFEVHGTGHQIRSDREYVGTVVYEAEGLVWHLYEVTA